MTRVNIVGCGPTGMTIAWELSKLEGMNIHIYDKKPGPGGSWWEPDDKRDLHAPRALFKNAYVNFHSMLTEMGISWDELFGDTSSEKMDLSFVKNFSVLDLWKLTLLSVKVLSHPEHYKKVSLKDALGYVTPGGSKVLSSVPYIMDGVSWDKMSAYEFVMSANWVGLSRNDTQLVSGAVMNRKMENALKDKGVHFHYDKEVLSVIYKKDTHEVVFRDTDDTLSGDLLVLAVDHGPARWLVGENWGPEASSILKKTQYECITLLLEYNHPVDIESEFKYVIDTPWNIIVDTLADGVTVAVTLCDTEAVGNTPPVELLEEIYKQTKLPRGPVRICWGSEWDGEQWVHHQTSGLVCNLPFWGVCPNVALCGMMSPRGTPFASIEAAVEVGRIFTRDTFGVGKVLTPLKVTRLVLIIVGWILLLILIQNYTPKMTRNT